jgi:hypothetical protein
MKTYKEDYMSDGFRTDYRAMMEKNKRTFPEIYEKALDQYEDTLGLSGKLKAELKAKREYGLTKYKDLSFQSNFDNALSAPALVHLKEELVDALNYSFHYLFQLHVQGSTPREREAVEVAIQRLVLVYEQFCD